MTTTHTISVQGTPEDPIIVEETIMTEETATRTRRKNPLVEYEKARAFADRARKAAARAVDLADKARVASEKADVLTAQKDDAETAEQAALSALQDHLAGLQGSDTVTAEDVFDEDDDE